jgi:hypothetical protein
MTARKCSTRIRARAHKRIYDVDTRIFNESKSLMCIYLTTGFIRGLGECGGDYDYTYIELSENLLIRGNHSPLTIM